MGTSKNSHVARCGRFLKAQKEFLNGLPPIASQRRGKAYRADTPTEEYSSLSQKDPQPAGRQILMDSDRVANPVTARYGAAPGVCSSCPPVALGRRGMSALHNLLSRAICQFLEVALCFCFYVRRFGLTLECCNLLQPCSAKFISRCYLLLGRNKFRR